MCTGTVKIEIDANVADELVKTAKDNGFDDVKSFLRYLSDGTKNFGLGGLPPAGNKTIRSQADLK